MDIASFFVFWYLTIFAITACLSYNNIDEKTAEENQTLVRHLRPSE